MYFGAPILSGLAALGSGADLVYLLVPECNFEVSRSFYPDFIVRKYPGNFINSRTVESASELLPNIDSVLIGPGISEDPESMRAITRIIQKSQCQIVLDAEAIPAIAQLGLISGESVSAFENRLTITPHMKEMDELIEGSLPENYEELINTVGEFAKKWGITILLKNPLGDIVASPDQTTKINKTGNPGMTVGGSGDVLAGAVASLIAQHSLPYEACQCAAFWVGQSGDNLYKQKGYNFMATDIALELPYTIHDTIG